MNATPPYFAVIFTANRKVRSPEYLQIARVLREQAKEIPGYLGVDSAEQPDGLEITISYWDSLEAIQRWREHDLHSIAKERGKREWIENFTIKICKVEASYGS